MGSDPQSAAMDEMAHRECRNQLNDAEARARKHWERAEKAEGALKVAAMHNNELEEENDQLKAQVAELRSAIETLAGCLPDQMFVYGSCGEKWSSCKPEEEHETVNFSALLASPNPGAELLAKAKRAEKLYVDSMVAHRWFATHFGEVMNGRDFDMKCSMATDILLAKLDRLEALEKFARSLPCKCMVVCRSCNQEFWKILSTPEDKCCADPQIEHRECARCKALGTVID